MMDADGTITGVLPGTPGNYNNYSTGVLTISLFDASRFSSISAVTELFPVLAANPDYQPLVPANILAHVNAAQRIKVYASSARADSDDPLVPDIVTETPQVQVALVHEASGATVVDIVGNLGVLNTPGRDCFARVEARFEYDNGVEAALGPFSYMDRVDLTITFNG